jgi:hypothetical protein
MVTVESSTMGGLVRLGLMRTGPCDWVILDLAAPRSDARALVGAVSDDGDDVVVTWHRDVPLATRYLTAEDALDDISAWLANHRGGTRPIPIPHFPPASVH